MSLGLQHTKRRIASVSSTMKITKAMELVATAKLKVWKDKLLENYEYTQKMIDLVSYVFSHCENVDTSFSKENESANGRLYIIVTSNLGLCAGYNYNIFKMIDKKLNAEDEVLIIGSKGVNHYRKLNVKVNDSFSEKASNLDYATILKIGEYGISNFKSKKFKSVELVYTRYVNSLVFLPEQMTLLPIDINKASIVGDDSKDILMEPSPKVILETLIPLYVKSVLYGKMIESQVSEQASRRTAMETATDNAEEIKNKLLLEFNKARQAAITQEITEVVSGANAS